MLFTGWPKKRVALWHHRKRGHAPIHIDGAEVERVSCFQVPRCVPQRWSHLPKSAYSSWGDSRSVACLSKLSLTSIGAPSRASSLAALLPDKAAATLLIARPSRGWWRQWTASLAATSPLSIYHTPCLWKSPENHKSHPSYGLFTLLPSGRRYRSIWARITRLFTFSPRPSGL